MIYNDCIHYKVCENITDPSVKRIMEGEDVEKFCSAFVNESDVGEIVHGEWGNPLFIDGVWLFPCSNCHYSTASRSKDFKPCFCSNCGAKMGKRKEDEGK